MVLHGTCDPPPPPQSTLALAWEGPQGHKQHLWEQYDRLTLTH